MSARVVVVIPLPDDLQAVADVLTLVAEHWPAARVSYPSSTTTSSTTGRSLSSSRAILVEVAP